MSTRNGTTTTDLRLRSGPGTDFSIVTVLKPDTRVVILGEQGEWLNVQVGGKQGFVHHKFVLQDEQGVNPGFIITNPPTVPPPVPSPGTVVPAAGGISLIDIPLEPSADQMINLGSQSTAARRLVAKTWNKCGGLLAALAKELKFDPGVAVAVLAVESSGNAFAPDGRMIIRFENHHFFRHWGKSNPNKFNQHFRFNASKTWTGHQWRPATNRPWQDFHGNQDAEWQVFSFAAALDDTAAKLSISMGGPQIMGSNFTEVGYESVQQMFDAFSTSERHQIIGFFDFVQGPGATSRKLTALQRQDFEAFASQYNGPGQAAQYGSKIRSLFETFQALKPA